MKDKKPSGRKRGGTIKYDMVNCKIVMPMVDENDDLILLSNHYFLLVIYMSEKQKIINDVYFDKAGFGCKQRTLSEAREKDKTITLSDISEFFRKNVEQKRKPVGQNSFIAPHSAYEYQMDLFKNINLR